MSIHEPIFNPCSDRQLSQAKAIVCEAYEYPKDIRLAVKAHRERRAQLAEIERTGDENGNLGTDMMLVMASLVALSIVDHIDKGTPLDRIETNDDEITVVVNGIAQGAGPWFTSRINRAITAAAFIVDPVETAENAKSWMERT